MKIATRVKIDAGPLRSLRGGLGAQLDTMLLEEARSTKKYMEEFAPRGENRPEGEKPLAETFYIRRGANSGERAAYFVGSTSPKAAWVTYGTAPHIITPKNARFLRFVVNGEVVFAKIVHHPGTKPNPFMQRAADRARGEALGRYVPMLQRYLKSKST